MLHGSINHVSITVSDLPKAMEFFGPVLTFLGYTVGRIEHDCRSNHDLTVNINMSNGTAFNVRRHEQVDELHRRVHELGAEILDGPGEFPFGPGGYYACCFRGPDRLKFEVVHMPAAERAAEALARVSSRAGA